MMDSKRKKMIAPIVIALLLVAYEVFWLCVVLYLGIAMPYILLGAVVPIAIAVVMIVVTKERLDEIRSGEEDDLSNY